MILCPFDSAYLCTISWSIVPFFEMRASVPLGLLTFGLSNIEVILLSSLGGIITSAILLKILPPIIRFLKKHIPIFHKLLEKIFAKTRREHSKRASKLGALSLMIFVAIPIPGSGAWSGVLIAYLFGIPYWRAMFLISSGVIFSAIIMTYVTILGKGIWTVFAKTF